MVKLRCNCLQGATIGRVGRLGRWFSTVVKNIGHTVVFSLGVFFRLGMSRLAEPLHYRSFSVDGCDSTQKPYDATAVGCMSRALQISRIWFGSKVFCPGSVQFGGVVACRQAAHAHGSHGHDHDGHVGAVPIVLLRLERLRANTKTNRHGDGAPSQQAPTYSLRVPPVKLVGQQLRS